MSDSGAPKHWLFTVIEPGDFKLPERAIGSLNIHTLPHWTWKKEELAEKINEEFILAGWQGIGYHFVVDRDGNICTGRPVDEVPIADSIHKPDALVIAAVRVSEKAAETIERFTQAILEVFTLARKSMKVHVE